MPRQNKNKSRTVNDYAGGDDQPRSINNPAPKKDMIGDDIGKNDGVEQKVDPEHRKVSGGASSGSFHGKQARSSGRGRKYP